MIDNRNKEDFLERWRRIQLQVPPGTALPEIPHVVSRVVDGQFVTLTTNQFSDDTVARLGGLVREVHRMSLEEIFVANVMHHREARGE